MRARLLPLLALVSFTVACSESDPSGDDGGDTSSGQGASGATGGSGSGGTGGGTGGDPGPAEVKIAHFNIKEFSTPKIIDADDLQANAAAELVGRINADIVCFNEMQFDIEGVPSSAMPGAPKGTSYGVFDSGAQNARRFADRVTAAHPEATYPETIQGLGNSGFYWEGDDFGQYFFTLRGWGEYRGRFNTACISRYPILRDQARIVTDIAWEDLPDNKIALMKQETDIDVPPGFPLFEKGLHVVPIQIGAQVVHFVLLHTVSPAFDPINPYRNYDELRGLKLFLDGQLPGVEPLPADAKFIVMGDLNADPEDGDGIDGAIQQVLEHPSLVAWMPAGEGGSKGMNGQHNSYLSGCGNDDGVIPPDPAQKFQLQLDYMLPSATLGTPLAGEIFFPDPANDKEGYDLACNASDHRLLWLQLEI